MLCIGILLAVVPAVSAGQGHDLYTGKNVNKDTTEISYIILPAEESSPIDSSPVTNSQSSTTLRQGQVYYSKLNINTVVKWLEVDLYWGVTANSLSLNVKNPKGVNLGTYKDSADGKTDGRIHISIYPSTGYVEKGTWVFTVKGDSVSGTQNYRLIFYTH